MAMMHILAMTHLCRYAIHMPVDAGKKRKEKFTLFSDHNGSLLRWQPGALMLAVATVQWLGLWLW